MEDAVGVDEPGLRRLPLEAEVQLAAQARVAAAGGRTALEEAAEAALDPGLRAFRRVGSPRDHTEKVPLSRRGRKGQRQGKGGKGDRGGHPGKSGHAQQSIPSRERDFAGALL